MWKKKRKSGAVLPSHFDTLISSKTQLEGDLIFSGGIHIDGKVKGTLRAEEGADALVRISDIGMVDGNVIAPHIIVNGTVNGDVYASKHIELAAKASIKGNVYYHLIEMEVGAEVNGNLVHHKEHEVTGDFHLNETNNAQKRLPEAAGTAEDGENLDSDFSDDQSYNLENQN